MSEHYDFTGETIPGMLQHLLTLGQDGLPLDSPHALRVKHELAGRGLPLQMTENLLTFALQVSQAGAKVTFTDKPMGDAVIAVAIGSKPKKERKRAKHPKD